MAIYGEDFRPYLNKFVFVRSTEGIEDISSKDPENINGYFAYIFWSNNGEICLRIADVGYGLEDYFETSDVGIVKYKMGKRLRKSCSRSLFRG